MSDGNSLLAGAVLLNTGIETLIRAGLDKNFVTIKKKVFVSSQISFCLRSVFQFMVVKLNISEGIIKLIKLGGNVYGRIDDKKESLL